MRKLQWNIAPDLNPERTKALSNALGINPTICRILSNRGIENFEEARAFFRPQLSELHDPFLMKDMDKAVSRIEAAVANKEKILVFGDYDVDGTTAVSLMYSFLSHLVLPENLDFYIPHRYREGYGVSKAGIEYAFENNQTLIIALDCGIKSVELVDWAASLGIDFIICDHHLPGSKVPEAVAILNAKQEDCPYPYKELCGCGVGFKLASALALKFSLPEESYLQYLDLVATAIAADIVPMTGENRVLAFYGLIRINSEPRAGISALKELAQVTGVMDISKVVFIIAPRVNAAGRMDDAKKAVNLFIENNSDNAKIFAEQLHTDNKDRKEADKSITEAALLMLQADPENDNRKTNVVCSENWHKGVVGIVASRIIESYYYRPTIVLTHSNGLISGSARSIPGFNLYEAIYKCKDHLVAYGGHFAAAGVSMLPENFEAFRKQFEEVVSSSIDEGLLTPKLNIDAELRFSEIIPSFFRIINQMAPFGPENLRPVFVSRNVVDKGFSKIVKEVHLRLVVMQDETVFTGIAFGQADKYELVKSGKPFDIAYSIDENEWNGTKSLQLMIEDIRPSQLNEFQK